MSLEADSARDAGVVQLVVGEGVSAHRPTVPMTLRHLPAHSTSGVVEETRVRLSSVSPRRGSPVQGGDCSAPSLGDAVTGHALGKGHTNAERSEGHDARRARSPRPRSRRVTPKSGSHTCRPRSAPQARAREAAAGNHYGGQDRSRCPEGPTVAAPARWLPEPACRSHQLSPFVELLRLSHHLSLPRVEFPSADCGGSRQRSASAGATGRFRHIREVLRRLSYGSSSRPGRRLAPPRRAPTWSAGISPSPAKRRCHRRGALSLRCATLDA